MPVFLPVVDMKKEIPIIQDKLEELCTMYTTGNLPAEKEYTSSREPLATLYHCFEDTWARLVAESPRAGVFVIQA